MSNTDPRMTNVMPQEPGRNPPRHVEPASMMSGSLVLGLIMAGALVLGVFAYAVSDHASLATRTDEPTTTTGQGGSAQTAPPAVLPSP